MSKPIGAIGKGPVSIDPRRMTPPYGHDFQRIMLDRVRLYKESLLMSQCMNAALGVAIRPSLRQRIRLLFTWRGLRMFFIRKAVIRAEPMPPRAVPRGARRSSTGAFIYCNPDL